MGHFGLRITQFGDSIEQVSIESGLLAGQYIDIRRLEVMQELALEPALKPRQSAERDVNIAVRQSLCALSREVTRAQALRKLQYFRFDRTCRGHRQRKFDCAAIQRHTARGLSRNRNGKIT